MQHLEATQDLSRFSRFAARGAPDEHGFFRNACEGVLKQEKDWRSQGLVWSWIDEAPVWESPVHWDQILPDPERELTRTIRFSLLGGGQITVVEKYERFRHGIPGRSEDIWCPRTVLRVTAQAPEGLRRLTGRIDRGWSCEMATNAAVFAKGTPQALVDRVAATFQLLAEDDHGTAICAPDPDRFFALLDRGLACSFCQRPLRDHVSTLLGYGPDCARQAHLPHNLDAATRILRKRAELLGE